DRKSSMLGQAQPAVRAEVVDVGWVAAVVTALDHLVLGEQTSEGANGGRLAGALLSADEHPADRRHYGVEDQRQLLRLLAYDCREGVGVTIERGAHSPKDRCGQFPQPVREPALGPHTSIIDA